MQRLQDQDGLDRLTDRGPGRSLRRLLAGNERFATGPADTPRPGSARPSEVADSQQPFAIVVGCVDSRVPPELVFDCGLGELLVVRTAGHVLDRAVLASIKFGVTELRIPLIVVLGHDRCAAVTAATEAGERPPADELGYLIRRIKPAVRTARRHHGDPVANAVRANATMVADRLASDSVIAEGLSRGALAVMAAHYDLESGRVELVT